MEDFHTTVKMYCCLLLLQSTSKARSDIKSPIYFELSAKARGISNFEKVSTMIWHTAPVLCFREPRRFYFLGVEVLKGVCSGRITALTFKYVTWIRLPVACGPTQAGYKRGGYLGSLKKIFECWQTSTARDRNVFCTEQRQILRL